MLLGELRGATLSLTLFAARRFFSRLSSETFSKLNRMQIALQRMSVFSGIEHDSQLVMTYSKLVNRILQKQESLSFQNFPSILKLSG